MPVTQSPSSEAMSAVVDRINSGEAYDMDVAAEYTEAIIDVLEELDRGLRIDVVCEGEQQLDETLDVEDRTQLMVRVFVRQKVRSVENDEIEPLKLLVRQLWQRLNNFETSDRRVKVWSCDPDPKEVPIKSILNTSWLFVATLVLVIEVEASV